MLPTNKAAPSGWTRSSRMRRRSTEDKRVDTVVVGSGIAGLSTAYELALPGPESRRARPRPHRRRHDVAHQRTPHLPIRRRLQDADAMCAASTAPRRSTRATPLRSIASKRSRRKRASSATSAASTATCFPRSARTRPKSSRPNSRRPRKSACRSSGTPACRSRD